MKTDLQFLKRDFEMNLTKTSKFIALILRHKPETIGISLDEHGWADVHELIDGINATGKHRLDMTSLEEIVRMDRPWKRSCVWMRSSGIRSMKTNR